MDILADRAAGLLTVEWADGHRSAYDFEWLRWNCPCAECAGEAGLPGRLAAVDHLRQEQYTLVSVEAVGLFGIRPAWRDGHDTGIYGLALLRSLCRCPECAERAAHGPLGHQAQNLKP